VVQGMLDAAFREDDGWVLLDYKTGGRGKSDEDLRSIYGPQLAYYAQALERLLGSRVKESWLVMLDLGRDIAVF
jgi:ATP-dependent helicase/nuclease subunit A